MPDYDVVVIGSGFAGSTATLSFLETTEKAGQVGSVALIETGRKGTWPGASRWTRPFMRLNRDNTLLLDRAKETEQELSDPDYWRKFEDEVPDTVEFMEDHGVKLIHHDEENAALDFEEQHFAHPVGGGKEIIDEYLIRIAKYESADVLYEHEATELSPRRRGTGQRRRRARARRSTAHHHGRYGHPGLWWLRGGPGDAHAVYRQGCG